MNTIEKIGIIGGVGVAILLIAKYVIATKPSPTPTQTPTQPQTGTLRLQVYNKSDKNAIIKISNKEEGEIASIPVNAGQSVSKDIKLEPGVYTISIWYSSKLLYAKDIKVEANKMNVFGYNMPHVATVHSVA